MRDPDGAASVLLRAAGAALLLMVLAATTVVGQGLDAGLSVGRDACSVRSVDPGRRCGGLLTRQWGQSSHWRGGERHDGQRRGTAAARVRAAFDADGAPRPLPDLPEGHSPKGALRRALVPGWGQIYNRQYYKLPFVYAGLGAFIGGVVWANQRYIRYRHAALYAQYRHNERNADPGWERFVDDYIAVVNGDTTNIIDSRRIRNVRDNLRRNRDLLVIGSVLYYGLTVLDAYVSAHLVAFDVGEDLSAAIRQPFGGRPVLSVRVRL